MKVIKFKKTLLKKNWEDILRHFNAVHPVKNIGFPQHIYMSSEDIKIVRKNVKNSLKKQHKFISKKSLMYAEGINFLNLGANSSYSNALKSGYALIEIKCQHGKAKKK